MFGLSAAIATVLSFSLVVVSPVTPTFTSGLDDAARPAQAQKTAPLREPTLTTIRTKKTSSKHVSVTVTAKRVNPKKFAVTPAPHIRVSIGKKSCTITKASGSCTLEKVKINSRVTLKVHQFNRHGAGPERAERIWTTADTRVNISKRNKGSVREPSTRPLVTKVVTKKTGKKTASVRVFVQRFNSGKPKVSPAPHVRVSIGKKSCVVTKPSGSCTIKDVKWNSRVSVKARHVNMLGTGPNTTHKVKANNATRVFYQTKGKSKTDRNRGRVLAQSNGKLTEVQAFKKAPSTRNAPDSDLMKMEMGKSVVSGKNGDPIVFDLSDAVALAKPESTGDSVGFYKLNRQGQVRDPLLSGDVEVREFFIAPDDTVYAAVANPWVVNCVLLRINSATGATSCVDSSLESLNWGDRNVGGLPNMATPPVQFDRNNNIYYVGKNTAGNTVLRRNSNGAIRDLVNQNVAIDKFFVAPNAEVIMCGKTLSTDRSWIRRVSPEGRLTNLAAVGIGYCNIGYMQVFEDGNLWMSQYHGRTMRYSLKEGKLLRDPYGWGDKGNHIIDFRSYDNTYQGMLNSDFLYFGYEVPEDAFNITQNRSTWLIRKNTLVRVVPSLLFAETSIAQYNMSYAYGDKVFLAGTDKKDVNRLILYNTTNGSERVIFDGRNEIEIYDMVYIPATNTLMFSGLRFSDNRFVVGEVRI